MISSFETLMLVNPESHGGVLQKEWPSIEREVRRALGDSALRVMFTTSLDHGAGMVRAALREGVRQVVAVGGDGTFAEVVQGFFQGGKEISPEAELILVPGGRGNDFFRMIANPGSSQHGWMRGIELMRNGTPRPCDLVQVRLKSRDGGVTSRLGLNLSSFGFGGHVVSRVHQKEGWIGRSFLSKTSLSYLLHSAATFMEYESVHLRVSVDGALVQEGKFMMGAVLNGAYNAGGLCWSKAARIEDGLLDLVLVPPLTGLDRARLLTALSGGDVASLPGAISVQGKHVEIVDLDPSCHRHKLIEVDGDLPEPPGLVRAEFSILPGAIRIRR